MSDVTTAEASAIDDLDDIIEIRDPEIDVNQIIARIREDLKKRPPLNIDFSALRFDPTGSSGPVDDRFLFNARRARQLGDKVFVGDQLMAPSGTVGKLLHPLRRQMHQLTRFYVDLLAGRQAVVNGHLVEALDALGEQHKAALARIETLEREIAALRAGEPAAKA